MLSNHDVDHVLIVFLIWFIVSELVDGTLNGKDFICHPPAQNQSEVAFFYFCSMIYHLKEKYILFTMTPKLSFYLNPNWIYG